MKRMTIRAVVKTRVIQGKMARRTTKKGVNILIPKSTEEEAVWRTGMLRAIFVRLSRRGKRCLYSLWWQLHTIKEGIDLGPAVRYENSVRNLGDENPNTEKSEHPRLNLQRASGTIWPNDRDEQEDGREKG